MSMPQIPEGKYRPTFDETIIDLFESIALEEISLSHLTNAEGEKLQVIIKKFDACEICHCQLSESFSQVDNLLNTIIMKEWILLNKLKTVHEIDTEKNDMCCR